MHDGKFAMLANTHAETASSSFDSRTLTFDHQPPEGLLMSAPEIGTTVSEGYRRGFDGLAELAPIAAVPALAVGAVAGVIAQVQRQFAPDARDIVNAVFSGKSLDKLTRGDLAMMNLLSAISSVVQLVVIFGGIVVFGEMLHRRRLSAAGTMTADAPLGADEGDEGAPTITPATALPAVLAAAGSLMPKLGVLVGLTVVGTLVSIVSNALGGLVSIVALVAIIYLGTRWIYAPIIAGVEQLRGDAAFTRSEQTVTGSFWPTILVFIVAGIAVGIPVAIVAAIVSTILPGAFLSAFGAATVSTIGSLTLMSAVFESAWVQVRDRASIDDAPPTV